MTVISHFSTMCILRQQLPQDQANILSLHQQAFGPGRFARTAFRIREQATPADELCFVALHAEALVGSVTLSHIYVNTHKALLLGPLAALPDHKNKGIGRLLMNKAVSTAFQQGHQHIILVGDAPYYAPFGFVPVVPGQIRLPGPVDPARVLICTQPHKNAQTVQGLVKGRKV